MFYNKKILPGNSRYTFKRVRTDFQVHSFQNIFLTTWKYSNIYQIAPTYILIYI